jgi:hypothetical protein
MHDELFVGTRDLSSSDCSIANRTRISNRWRVSRMFQAGNQDERDKRRYGKQRRCCARRKRTDAAVCKGKDKSKQAADRGAIDEDSDK